MRYDPFVYDKKSVFMQRLADVVRLGYRHYACGEVPLERAPALVAKFCRLYGVHLHRNQKARLRAAGEASAYLLLFHVSTDTLKFCLLLTAGQHAAYHLERMHPIDDRHTRLALEDYELVLRTRPGNARPSWTWRLTNEGYEGWRYRILEVCRDGNEFAIRQCVDSLLAMPGFAGIREQVKKLKALFRAEWKRRRPDSTMNPLAGRRQRYVQRLPDSGQRLRALVRKLGDDGAGV